MAGFHRRNNAPSSEPRSAGLLTRLKVVPHICSPMSSPRCPGWLGTTLGVLADASEVLSSACQTYPADRKAHDRNTRWVAAGGA
jgi:hypothetical protein